MSPKTMKLLAKPMLFAAAIIWGTSFFIMKNALDALPPFYLLAIRFTAGAVLLALIAWKKWQIFTWDHLWRGAVMGAFLFLAYSIQTFGLTLTTPSKNAFLTAVYCVLVPFLSWAVIRVRPDRFNIAAALLCVTGVGFVSLTEELTINARRPADPGGRLFLCQPYCGGGQGLTGKGYHSAHCVPVRLRRAVCLDWRPADRDISRPGAD